MTPSMYQRSGISRFISARRPGLRSEPINMTRGSRLAKSWILFRQVLRNGLLQRCVHLRHELRLDLCLMMPLRIILGEVNSFTLHRMTNNDAWSIAGEWNL